MRKVLIGLFSVLAAFLLACGGTGNDTTVTAAPTSSGTGGGVIGGVVATTAAAPAGPVQLAVGQTAQLSMADGSAATVVVSTVKVQGGFIVVSVTMTCTAGTVKYNMFDWKMLAGDGTTLDVGFSIDVKNQLQSGDLGPTNKVTGNLVYEGTSAQAKGALVQFAPGFKVIASWKNA